MMQMMNKNKIVLFSNQQKHSASTEPRLLKTFKAFLNESTQEGFDLYNDVGAL